MCTRVSLSAIVLDSRRPKSATNRSKDWAGRARADGLEDAFYAAAEANRPVVDNGARHC
jgi:hypothetical protein